MSKQYHYVVCYDVDTDTFSLDLDSLYARFEHIVYNTTDQEWEEEVPDSYYTVEDNLAILLTHKMS